MPAKNCSIYNITDVLTDEAGFDTVASGRGAVKPPTSIKVFLGKQKNARWKNHTKQRKMIDLSAVEFSDQFESVKLSELTSEELKMEDLD